MKFHRVKQLPAQSGLNPGDEYMVKANGATDWQMYKVDNQGVPHFVRGISNDQNQKLNDLKTQSEITQDINDMAANAASSLIEVAGTVLPRGSSIPSYITTKGKAELSGGNDPTGITYTNTGTTPSSFTVPKGSIGYAFYDKVNDSWSLAQVVELPSTPVANEFGSSTTEGISQNKATELKKDKLEVVEGTEITTSSVLTEEGVFQKDKTEITSFPFVGTINSNTGVYTAASGRKATDFVPLTGFTHVIVKCDQISSVIGSAFYSSNSEASFLTGVPNAGINTEQLIKVPVGATHGRFCSYNTSGQVWLLNVVENKENMLTFVSASGSVNNFITKPGAVEFMDSAIKDKAIIYKPGQYDINELDLELSGYTPGFVSRTTGVFTASSSWKVSAFVDVSDYDGILATGVATGSSAGIVFYDENQLYVQGFALATNVDTPYFYTKPTSAKYVRHSIANASVNRIGLLKKSVTVQDNEIAFIENGVASVYKGGGDNTPISGAELISDLPVGDGSGISIGDAYIDSSTGNVKVRLL